MMGGFRARDPTDEDVLDAAAQGAALVMARSNALLTGAVGPANGAVCPESQVVAGTNYRMVLLLGVAGTNKAVQKFRVTLHKPLKLGDGEQPRMQLLGDGFVFGREYVACGAVTSDGDGKLGDSSESNGSGGSNFQGGNCDFIGLLVLL